MCLFLTFIYNALFVRDVVLMLYESTTVGLDVIRGWGHVHACPCATCALPRGRDTREGGLRALLAWCAHASTCPFEPYYALI